MASDSSSEYDRVVKVRRYIRSKITRIFNIVSNDIDTLNELRRKEYVIKLHDLMNELKAINGKVYNCLEDCDDDSLNQLLTEEEEYDYKVTLALATLEPISDSNGNQNGNAPNVSIYSTRPGASTRPLDT